MTVKKRSPEAHQLKDHMNKVAPPIIREKFAEYLRCMKEGECISLLIPHYIISNKSDRLKSVGYIGA